MDILKRMISYYNRIEIQFINLDIIYFWVKELYIKLEKSGKFPHMRIELLLNKMPEILNPFPFPEKSADQKIEYIIHYMLSGFAQTEAKTLDELGIDMGEPDFKCLTEKEISLIL
jgi:hypothetical protein